MARTIPREWILESYRPPTPETVKRIYDQYVIALGDEDKATDPEDNAYYEGWRESLEWVLDMLYGIENITLPESLKMMFEEYCACPGGPKLDSRRNWAKPRCGYCRKFVRETTNVLPS